MLHDNALQAFSSTAGISADNLSLLTRTSLLTGFFIWASWCALELMKYHKNHPSENIANLVGKYIQLFFIVSVIITLVFKP